MIDHLEQEMNKGVLNLQDQQVREIMKPCVEVLAVPKSISIASVLGVRNKIFTVLSLRQSL